MKLHTFVKDISPDKESRGITNPLAKDRVISREKKKKWNYVRTPRTVVTQLLLGVIFLCIATQSVCYLEYCGDQLKRSFDETSFVNRYINLIVC